MTTTQPLAQHPLAPRTAYAELHCYSNYTFLKGASHPEELVERCGRSTDIVRTVTAGRIDIRRGQGAHKKPAALRRGRGRRGFIVRLRDGLRPRRQKITEGIGARRLYHHFAWKTIELSGLRHGADTDLPIRPTRGHQYHQ